MGIDQGGATQQGLETALELFDEVFIFHDRTGRTFHPKVYFGWGAGNAVVLVGSHNVTAGGAYYNYEAGVELTLALPDDDATIASVHDFIALLLSDTGACRRLTPELLTDLASDPRYKVQDEDRPRSTPADAPTDLDTDTDVEIPDEPAASSGESIFGRSTHRKRPGPRSSTRGGRVRNPATPSSGSSSPSGSSAVVVRRWFKRLSGSDAQRPPRSGSNVTGVLRLVQAGHSINQTNYFRQTFFAALPWAGTQKARGLFEQTVAGSKSPSVGGQSASTISERTTLPTGKQVRVITPQFFTGTVLERPYDRPTTRANTSSSRLWLMEASTCASPRRTRELPLSCPNGYPKGPVNDRCYALTSTETSTGRVETGSYPQARFNTAFRERPVQRHNLTRINTVKNA